MYDFIEEYFSQIVIGMLILAIGGILIISSATGKSDPISTPIIDNTLIAPQEAIKEEASIGKDGIILSGSTQDLNVQNTIMSNAQDSITPTTFFTVKRVIDGDTIDIGLDANVRILGIDAPESTKVRYGYVECAGNLASDYTKSKLLGKQIRIEKDTIQPERDRYGRYLLHIWIDDKLFANDIISDGYAKQYIKSANTYSSILASAESLAQVANRGLWGDCQ